MRHIKYILTIIGLVCTTISSAQYKYAAPDADPATMDGTIDHPYDLQTALSTLLPGETLWLRDGDYTEKGTYITNGAHGTAGNPITIASYPGEWARLNGNVICTNIVGADDENELEEGEEPDPGSVVCKSVLNVNKHYYIFKNFEITMISDDDSSTIDDNFSRYRGNYTSTIANPSSNPESYPLINRGGINHTNGINCKFINLIIHNLGGNGIGSWRATGGAEIYSCLIYNNGDQAIYEGQPVNYPQSGSGIYMQNQTELWKNINNNIFFNNFKVGAKLWSASNIAPHVDFLKHVNFNNNVILNTGSPLDSGIGKECFIAAGASEVEGEGIVHDVNIERNFMYHNESVGIQDGANEVLLIGTELVANNIYYNQVNNIKILNNYLIGGKQGVRFVRVKDLEFKRNVVKSNFVFSISNMNSPNMSNFDQGLDINENGIIEPDEIINNMNSLSWDFENNRYFTRDFASTERVFAAEHDGGGSSYWGKRTLDEVRGITDPDHPNPDRLEYFESLSSIGNKWGSANHVHNILFDEMPAMVDEFNIYNSPNVISITQNKFKPNEFKIVVFERTGEHVKVNLFDYNIPNGLTYSVRDAENYFTVVDNPSNDGNIFNANTNTIVMPMSLPEIDVPNGHYPAKDDWNVEPRKSDIQIGVFIVEFDTKDCELQYILQGFNEDEDKLYLAEDNITTGEHPDTELPYVVDSDVKVTHKAGTNIILKAGTQIKPRVDADHPYLAQIELCSSSNSGLEYTGETYPEPEMRKGITQRDENEKEIQKIKVFPNPTTTKIAISSSQDMSYLTLSNTLGRTLLEMNVNQNSPKNAELNLSNVPIGMYFLQIRLSSGEIITKQIIKK